VHRQIDTGVTSVDYSFMGQDPNAADDQWLREAKEARVPIVYFIGVAPGLYEAAVPTFICGWDPARLKASVVFGEPAQAVDEPPVDDADRRYGLRLVKQRRPAQVKRRNAQRPMPTATETPKANRYGTPMISPEKVIAEVW
jgi:putative restriction endonuclease